MVVVLAACTEPALLPDAANDPESPQTPDAAEDPSREQLTGHIDVLRETVAAASEQLRAAASADTPADARSAVQDALGRLLDDPAVSGTDLALLPAASADREVAGDQDDGLTTLLTLARDTGGALGDRTIEALRHPIAGDLGAWERDAAGVVDSVERTIATSRDLDVLEDAIRELPGDATRALAWTMLASRASDRDAIAAYAERGAVHLDFVLAALDQLSESM